jgi:hypothetical protein
MDIASTGVEMTHERRRAVLGNRGALAGRGPVSWAAADRALRAGQGSGAGRLGIRPIIRRGPQYGMYSIVDLYGRAYAGGRPRTRWVTSLPCEAIWIFLVCRPRDIRLAASPNFLR